MTTLADIQAEQALDTQRTSRAELTVSFAHTGKTAGTLCVDQCMVPEVIGKGGSNIEALSKAAGISRKPFYDKDHKAFMLNNMTTDKMEALQKEVQQFLRIRLGERSPQKKKVVVSGMKGVSNQFEHLADEDVVEEEEQPTNDSNLLNHFRVRGNIDSRKWWKEHWKRRKSDDDSDPCHEEDTPTLTLAEFEERAPHAPKKQGAAAKKSKRQIPPTNQLSGCILLSKKTREETYTF